LLVAFKEHGIEMPGAGRLVLTRNEQGELQPDLADGGPDQDALAEGTE
jgi:hypothetical protein